MKHNPTDDILLLTLSLLHDLDPEEQRGEHRAGQHLVSGFAKAKEDLKEAREAAVTEFK